MKSFPRKSWKFLNEGAFEREGDDDKEEDEGSAKTKRKTEEGERKSVKTHVERNKMDRRMHKGGCALVQRGGVGVG